MGLAAISYIVLGPAVFPGPLMPFRQGMVRTKTDLMNVVARRLRVELSRVRDNLRDGPITKEDEELIERLRKIGTFIDELPVWPFDARTLRKFMTAYVIPVVGSASYPAIKFLIELIVQRVRP
jgi:hypothetical protein